MDNKQSAWIGGTGLGGLGAITMGLFPPPFLSDIPAWSRDTIGYIGLACVIGSLIALIKPHWFQKPDALDRTRFDSIDQSRLMNPTPDMSIRDLFLYIRPDALSHRQTVWDEISRQVTDKISTGQLKVWGRKMSDKGWLSLARISMKKWRDPKFTYTFFDPKIKNTMQVRCSLPGHEFEDYTDLQFNQDQVIKATADISRASVLFADNKGEPIYLRFLPDTASKNADALLLIIYGHALLRKENEVSADAATQGLYKSGCFDPKNLNASADTLYKSRTMSPATADDIAKTHIESGLITKAGLSRGGFFRLTPHGERVANSLVFNLVARA